NNICLNFCFIAGGTQLRALVFVVIATTVTVQGLSAGWLAAALGLRRSANTGYLFVGANLISIHLAKRFAAAGHNVELVDTSNDQAKKAQLAGVKLIFGNALDPRTLAKARIDTRSHAIALTASESVNMLFAQRVAELALEPPKTYVAIDDDTTGVSPEMVKKAGARTLFGHGVELDTWLVRFRHRHATITRWMFVGSEPTTLESLPETVLPLFSERHGVPRLVDETTELHEGDTLEVATASDAMAAIDTWLAQAPWVPVVEVRAIS
ncbi:MAG TPA: NAD-binding protein, partial [Kofleriaceae bacterium]